MPQTDSTIPPEDQSFLFQVEILNDLTMNDLKLELDFKFTGGKI